MIDEDEFEAYLKMTPEQQKKEDERLDAEIENLMREHAARLAAMTLSQQVAYRRGRSLAFILTLRRNLRDPVQNRIDILNDMRRKWIRGAQIRLLKLREWRRTGVYPGSS